MADQSKNNESPLKYTKEQYYEDCKKAYNDLKSVYLNLLKSGWKLNDIDEMDYYFFLELLDFKEEDTYEDTRPMYADEIDGY